jgi:hypothetical protein
MRFMLTARPSPHVSVFIALSLAAVPAIAQLGAGWVEYSPKRTVHLENFKEKTPQIYAWPTPYQSYGDPITADYRYEPETSVETFRLFGPVSAPPSGTPPNGNRSEIRLFNEYEFGSRQFEGYVTFFPPLDDEGLFQIWGSKRGATQLMVRGYAADNGCIGVQWDQGGPKFLKNLYGREFRLNVIHLQEDVGNKIIVYVDGEKLFEFPDDEKAVNNKNQNYHKYGVYGTVRKGHEEPKVIWRKVRHFQDGAPPAEPAAVKPAAGE